MSKVRLISDVHGKYSQYLSIVKDANKKGLHTIQLGDLGFYDTYLKILNKIDTTKNKFFMGNHDGYNSIDSLGGFCLGDYGMREVNGIKFFFIRGAFSIDKKYRTMGLDWFPEEELGLDEHQNVIDLYAAEKPDVVLSHDFPDSVGNDGVLKNLEVVASFGFSPLTFNTKTQTLLQKLFEIHSPTNWYGGHFHKNWTDTINGTKFQCLAELNYIDIG